MRKNLEEDWYCVETLKAGIYAIGEPLYEQQNWSYLFAGEKRSLLFDTGSYFGDITPVVHKRTSGPLTALPSHMHYDHLGNVARFDTVALPDLKVLSDCCSNGEVTPTGALFLGEAEDRTPPTFPVRQWLEIGSTIDLGGIRLKVLHTPGHSPDSISLWDAENGLLFAADFIYPGPLYAHLPGASLGDYLSTAIRLRNMVGGDTAIYCAHGDMLEGEEPSAPKLDETDIDALISGLETLRKGSPALTGVEPLEIEISDRLQLMAGADALRSFVEL